MTIHTDIEQGTPEWLEIRAGRIGGTSSAALLVDGRNGSALGKGAMTLVYKNAAELITGPSEESFSSFAAQRGTDLEPEARRRYEMETFQTVREVGYISDGDYLGFSPDGLVGDDGMIEIKCPLGPEFVRYADTMEIPKDYYCQMQWGLWISGRQWCDYVVYHPDFEPYSIIIRRIKRDDEMHWQFSEKVPLYIAEMERVLNSIAAQKQDA